MNPNPESIAFDRAVKPVLRRFLPSQIVDDWTSFDLEPGLRSKIEELAARSTEGDIISSATRGLG